jgi:hypothetical protein
MSSYIFNRLGFQKLLIQGKPGVYKLTNANRHRVTWNINLGNKIPKVNEKLRGNNKLHTFIGKQLHVKLKCCSSGRPFWPV